MELTFYNHNFIRKIGIIPDHIGSQLNAPIVVYPVASLLCYWGHVCALVASFVPRVRALTDYNTDEP